MTLSKLAQLANVSVSVVSKAFSGRSDISDVMREHVFSVARKHGCFHQFYHARYDKPVIAVIIPEVISKYYVGYVEILKKAIENSGYTMLLSINNFDEQLTCELIRYYTEKKGEMLYEELSRIGIGDPALMYSSRLRFENAAQDGVRHLFVDKQSCPTAIFGAYGYITQGIISALEEKGYSIPGDVSVISMDNVPAPLYTELDVAYISYNMERACEEAISLLKKRIGNGEKQNFSQVTELHATFYRGESVKKAN